MAENLAFTLEKSNAIDANQQVTARLDFDGTTIVTTDYAELDLGFKPRYVCVENVTTLAKFEWQEGLTATITAGSFVVGTKYKIVSAGTTDFTLIGAKNNTVGTEFVATGVGTGTGTAKTNENVCIKTVSGGTRTLVVANSILVNDRAVQLSQNSTTGIIAINTALLIRAIG